MGEMDSSEFLMRSAREGGTVCGLLSNNTISWSASREKRGQRLAQMCHQPGRRSKKSRCCRLATGLWFNVPRDSRRIRQDWEKYGALLPVPSSKTNWYFVRAVRIVVVSVFIRYYGRKTNQHKKQIAVTA